MQKLKLKSGQITQTWKLPIERPHGIVVECSNGEEFPVEKIYKVTGRGGSIKILTGGDGTTNKLLDKIDDLEDSLRLFEEENKNLKEDLEEWQKIASTPSEISAKIKELDDECNNVQTAIENLEYKLGLQTKCRQTYDRIDALAEILEDKIRELEN